MRTISAEINNWRPADEAERVGHVTSLCSIIVLATHFIRDSSGFIVDELTVKTETALYRSWKADH
jgi:hypothetical protein